MDNRHDAAGLKCSSAIVGCLGWLWAATECLAQTAESQAADSVKTGMLDIVFSGGWVGFLIVMLLVALSMTAAYLVFEQLMTIRESELIPPGLDTQFRDLLMAGRAAEAEAACRQRPSFLSFVLLHGLTEVGGGWPAVEKALEDATAEQSAKLFRKIEYLSVIGNIAPMVGLLGTVTGMILAFQRVATTQGAAGAAELAEGIYQALITTVGGLIVAIPSLGAFAIFRNRVDQFAAEAAYAAQQAFAPLKRRPKREHSRRPPPAPPRRADAPPPPAPPKGS
jgi:biopolymer transport protein ExbB